MQKVETNHYSRAITTKKLNNLWSGRICRSFMADHSLTDKSF